MLGAVNLHLESRGIKSPSSTKNREPQRDPEMHQTKKANQWCFGMKAHVGVDSKDEDHSLGGGNGSQPRGFSGAAG
jgi:IS5 family transposase